MDVVLDRLLGRPPPGSGTAGRYRRRSPGRRRRWRSPSGRGRDRPGPSWRPGCGAAAVGLFEALPPWPWRGRRRDRRRFPSCRPPGSYWIVARWRPNTFSMARPISPTVAWARGRVDRPGPAGCPRPSRPPPAPFSAARRVQAGSRSASSRASFSSCWLRTEVLSTFSIGMSSASSACSGLTPTTLWRLASMRAWVLAAASSMRSLGMPGFDGLGHAAEPPGPPRYGPGARRARSWVRRST